MDVSSDAAPLSMTAHDKLMTTRFTLNMERIHSLIKLIHSDIEQLKPTALFRSEGPRADILRAIVVFLHATFEDVLRTGSSRKKGPLNFHSGADITKALKNWQLSPKPFEPLYPPLTQMAKRRHRVVHGADLAKKADTTLSPWAIADEWQLIMWVTAVPTFFWLLRSQLDPTNEAAAAVYLKLRAGMDAVVALGHSLLEFTRSPNDLKVLGERVQAIIESGRIAVATLTEASELSAKV
jgi:hypothetical protein